MAANKIGISLGTIHKVTSSKINASFDRQGKNGFLAVTSETAAGIDGGPSPVDATNRVVTYPNFAAFAEEWDASSPTYQAVQAAETNGGGTEIAVGFYTNAGNITNELNEIRRCYSNFFVFVTPMLKDDPRQLDVAAWAASFSSGDSTRYAYSALTCDPLALDPNDTTSIGSQIDAAGYPTLVNYQDASFSGDLAAEAAGRVASQDFDLISGYTLYEARLTGTPASPLDDSDFATLQSKNINAKYCVVGPNIDIYLSGVLGDGTFIDSCQKLCYINIQLQESQLAESLEDGPPRNSREGYQDYIDRYEEPLALALQRELITSYNLEFPRFEEISQSQRAGRDAVCGRVSITDNGFIHGSCIDVQFTL